jgi:integrase
MYNPSYLIKSRHGIYYFRYPLPVLPEGKSSRISISLGTRCPREALQLSKALEYYSTILIQRLNWEHMNHSDIKSILREHFAEALTRIKSRIDKDGPMPNDKVKSIKKAIQAENDLIEDGSDDIYELYGLECEPEENYNHQSLLKIMQEHGLDFPVGSKEYNMMKEAHKFARRDHFENLIDYNDQSTNYRESDTQPNPTQCTDHNKEEYRLNVVIQKYLSEIKVSMKKSSLDEIIVPMRYLEELMEGDTSVVTIDGKRARYVKECLMKTPANRNKLKATRALNLVEQLEIKNVKHISVRTINKYLQYFSGLFKWLKNNKYITDNPFEDMKLKNSKEDSRDPFSKDEVSVMLSEIAKGDAGLANNDRKYWGALLAIYTGARLNEISSLTPDDIKKDDYTGIWYLSITDEEESKKLKTSAAKRIVPVHSHLLNLDFLKFVDKSRKIGKRQQAGNTRLLYDLTHHNKDGWGRKLGRWFNETFLTNIKLKTDKKVLHSLRHSFITNLSAANVDGGIIKAIVGHEDSSVTVKTYTHYDYDTSHLTAFKEAIEKLEY